LAINSETLAAQLNSWSPRFHLTPALNRRSIHAAFLVVWEAQSQVATLAFFGLVAFGSMWLALPVMLVWAGIATIVYFAARHRGFPDILEHHPPAAGASSSCKVRFLAVSCVKVWFAGLQAFAFSRATRGVLNPSLSGWKRLARPGLLVVGLTMFGVATAHHLLRGAGYQGARLLQLALAGALLNVVYRTLLSAALAHAAWELFYMLQPPTQL
jgi:hypothetical protein